MSEFDTILSAASQLPITDRLRLIDELASLVPDDRPPALSEEWLTEIERRSEQVDSGSVTMESWADVRARLFRGHGIDSAD